MDYGGFDTVKAEKIVAMKKFKRKNKAKKYLRYAIVAASAVFLSWSSVWIPILIQTTMLYIRVACTVVASQKFIFFMCNVIILTLAAKSGQLSSGGGSGSPDLYEEFMKNSENRPKYVTNPELVEKQCVSEDSAAVPATEVEKSTVEEVEEVTKEVVMAEVTSSSRRKIERSQSEKLERSHPRSERRLQRSETAIVSVETQPDDGENSFRIESTNESNEELTKRIEDFISRQLSRQREEEETLRFAVVVQS